MPAFCAVYGCSNRHDRERDRSYYRLPKVITHQGQKTKDLSQARQEKWLTNIARLDIKSSSYGNLRICSDHFITKPSDLYDTLNPDWAPTVSMGRPDTFCSPPPSKERYKRLQNRSAKKKHSDAAVALLDLQSSIPEKMNDEELETGISTQTSIDQKLMTAMEAELSRLQQQNFDMKRKLECQKFDVNFFVDEDTKVKYYTGLTNYHILKSLFDYISQDIIVHHKSVLNKFQQLVLCLMKLRLNSSNQDLADRFHVSDTTVSRVFLNVLDILYACLKPVIHWPDREQIQKTMPMSFRAHFGTKVAVIIDCFEVFIERPSNLRARGETWSNYKHNHTAKYLIGITPQGVISFISDGYGGRASDKTITETCGFLNKLTSGDVVLADRGFDIQDIVGTMCAQVYIPAFTRGKAQLGALDVERTRRIANVERVIGVVRQKYSLLSTRLPHDFIHSAERDNSLTVDKIVLVCCALTNLCNSVVPFN